MRIFLTGATGYIGSAVLDALVRGGHDVTALVRDNEKARARRDARRASGGRQSRRTRVVPRGRRGAGRLHAHGVRFDVGGGPAIERRRSRRSSRRRSGRAPPAPNAPPSASSSTPRASGCSAARRSRRPRMRRSTRSPLWRGVPTHEQLVLDARGDASAHRRRPARRRLRRRRRHRRRPLQVRDATAWSASSATATTTGRSSTTATSPTSTRGWRRIDDAAGIYHANDEGDERVNDIVGAIAPYLPVQPDVRHVPIEEARHKMGAYADALALDQVVRSPRARALGWTPTLHSVAGNAARLLEEWRASRN